MARSNKDSELSFSLAKMNFIVTAGDAAAAFAEVSGVEASVDVLEYRQGNVGSPVPVKMPGLIKHGNVTLKFGRTLNDEFLKWAMACVGEEKEGDLIREVKIEVADIPEEVKRTTGGSCSWILKNAWVTKYSVPDLNAMASEVAIESVELAYEKLIVPGEAANNK